MRGNSQLQRSLLATALALGLVAACSNSDGLDASGSLPTTTPDSNTEVAVSSDDTQSAGPVVTKRPATSLPSPDTTELAATTSTSPASTTTTEPLPAANGASLLLVSYGTAGGWNGTEWNRGNWDEGPGDLPSFVGQEISVITIDGLQATAVASEPSDVCGLFGSFGLNAQPSLDADHGFPEIGVISDWDPVPQTWQDVQPLPDVYLEELRRTLDAEGLDPDVANVDQAIRIDLEGDGVDEVFLVSNDSWDFTVGPTINSHSLTLMRRVVEEEVQTARLFFTRRTADDAESFFFLRSRIAGFADLNGDGKMEILTQEEYYEGSSVIAWEYVNNDIGPVEVLATGCGV